MISKLKSFNSISNPGFSLSSWLFVGLCSCRRWSKINFGYFLMFWWGKFSRILSFSFIKLSLDLNWSYLLFIFCRIWMLYKKRILLLSSLHFLLNYFLLNDISLNLFFIFIWWCTFRFNFLLFLIILNRNLLLEKCCKFILTISLKIIFINYVKLISSSSSELISISILSLWLYAFFALSDQRLLV